MEISAIPWKALRTQTGLERDVCKRLGAGANLHQDSKWKFWDYTEKEMARRMKTPKFLLVAMALATVLMVASFSAAPTQAQTSSSNASHQSQIYGAVQTANMAAGKPDPDGRRNDPCAQGQRRKIGESSSL
jgi:hypothetical protein